MPKKSATTNALPKGRGTYFASLQIKNVRCFAEPQTLRLTAGEDAAARWTVILGENGVGKTTLLQALALSAGGYRHEPYMFDFWEPEGGPPPPIEFARSREKPGVVKIGVLSGGKHREMELVLHDERAEVPEKPILDPPMVVCGYGANRRIGGSRWSKRYRSRFGYASLFVDAPLRNAEEWLLGEDYAAAKEGGSTGPAKRRLERLKELLVHLLPEVKDVRVGEPRPRWEPGVEFNTPYGWVPLWGLRLGYQSLVAWMVDFAATMFDKYEKHEDPLAEPAVVLVDEIDLHLHPKWQRKLLDLLTERFPKTQFITTAHSPLIVQAAEGANVVLLQRQGEQVVITDAPQEVRNWRIDQILTSDLYGLPTARPPRLDALISERRELLTRATLRKEERRRLSQIEREMGDLPGGESPEVQRAMDLILKSAGHGGRKAAGGK